MKSRTGGDLTQRRCVGGVFLSKVELLIFGVEP